eukprot:SAG25_NODE_40_length_19529_cov_9.183942_1_plen_80_part_10
MILLIDACPCAWVLSHLVGWRGEAAITNATQEYLRWWKDLQQYANGKGLELGVYDSGVVMLDVQACPPALRKLRECRSEL